MKWLHHHQPNIEVSLLALGLFAIVLVIVPTQVTVIPGYLVELAACFVAAGCLVRWAHARWLG